jgi:hypothetical protein
VNCQTLFAISATHSARSSAATIVSRRFLCVLAAPRRLILLTNLRTHQPRFANLTRLHTLVLDQNDLVSLPRSIGSMMALREGAFSHFLLSTLRRTSVLLTHPPPFPPVYIAENKLHVVPLEITRLAALTELCLEGNPFVSDRQTNVLPITDAEGCAPACGKCDKAFGDAPPSLCVNVYRALVGSGDVVPHSIVVCSVVCGLALLRLEGEPPLMVAHHAPLSPRKKSGEEDSENVVVQNGADDHATAAADGSDDAAAAAAAAAATAP